MANSNNLQQAGSGTNVISAIDFFKISGRHDAFKTGTCLFTETRRMNAVMAPDARICLLLSGTVTLTRYGKPVSLIMPGEIFGASPMILPSPHFTTTTVYKDCAILSLEPRQFLQDLQKHPTFILTLLSDLARQLQGVMPRALKLGRRTERPPVSTGIDADQVKLLAQRLGEPVPSRSDAGGTVISAGGMALYMYVLKEGRVNIMVADQVVEVVQAGTVFGEMALAGSTRRTANALAETASSWYSIDANQLVAITKADPALGLALMRSLAKRIQHAGHLICESSLDLAALHLPRLNLTERDAGNTAKRAQDAAVAERKVAARAFLEQTNEIMSSLTKALTANDKMAALAKTNQLIAAAAKIGAERLSHHADTLCTALSVGQKDIVDEVNVAVQSEYEDTCGEIVDFIGAVR